MTTPRFVDSHAHLDGEKFAQDLEDTLRRARDVGLTDIVCIGASDGFESNKPTLALAEKIPHVFATVGIHPHDAKVADAACLAEIRALAKHPKVVGIGETGLDYYYDHSPREAQQDAFRAFLAMARELQLPVVVHTRDAEDDTIQILREEKANEIGGVLHCFTGTEKLAAAAMELDLYVSFSGVLTFKNADPLRAIAKGLRRDRVLVETDCPYLAPIPYRGKRNEPAYVVHTAKVLADVWGVSLDDVKAITGANAVRMFKLPAEPASAPSPLAP
ncbi:TatD family hydrolase, partial [Myxococcota bacterium]|nr:TatD family hydrolase [Myxococcota bacterium]